MGSALWPDRLALRVRMGVHTGEVQERSGNYFGSAVNRAARVMDAANGAQILVSVSTREVMSGDQDEAWRWVDLGVHELRDVVDPMRLYRIDSPSFASDPRPPRSGSVSAGNLPAIASTLVGRSDDVHTIVHDLATSRVVTLSGVGGIGKTQLALAVGRQMQSRDACGVWFAPLDTIDRPEALLSTLFGQLCIEGRAGSDLTRSSRASASATGC